MRRIEQDPSLVQFVDRGNSKKEVSSLPPIVDATTRSEELEGEGGEPAETLTDILSLSFLIGWSFVCLVASLAMRFWFKMGEQLFHFSPSRLVVLFVC